MKSEAMLPQAIDLRPEGLRVRWTDREVVLGARDLRAACRCGGCRAAAAAGRAGEPTEGVHLVGAEPVGQYALQLLFSDGHDRGIYPWELLRALETVAAP